MYNNGEIEDVMSSFEKSLEASPVYVSGTIDHADREEVDIGGGRTSKRFLRNNYYSNGEINKLFLCYLWGYATGKSRGQLND